MEDKDEQPQEDYWERFFGSPAARTVRDRAIRRICRRLEKAWLTPPFNELRLGQLLINCSEAARTPLYYMPDENLLHLIEIFCQPYRDPQEGGDIVG